MNKKPTKSEKEHELPIQELSLIKSETLPVLAAGLAHEVKNPLAAIHLHLQLLENEIYLVEDEKLRSNLLNRIQIIKKRNH